MNGIAFARPYLTGRETRYLQAALESGQLAGNGPFSRQCAARLEDLTGTRRAFLTGSGTHALEMAFLVLGITAGDEVIMPSFTFPSCANAVALRGATPVFVDIRPDTQNIDEETVGAAITLRTRAILVVHYAGVACDMARIAEVAGNHGVAVIEDAAHAIGASWQDRPLGSIGHLGAFSFHQTKNLAVGEGGALLVNEPELVPRAEIAWEKGTDRLNFERGKVNKYSWVGLGSSWLAGELTAAPLLAQLEEIDAITARRRAIWQRYHEGFSGLEVAGRLRRPTVPDGCRHNGHLYYLLAQNRSARDAIIDGLLARNISAITHYAPLHTSLAGKRYGRPAGPLPNTEAHASRLLRLPLHPGLSDGDCDRIIAAVAETCG